MALSSSPRLRVLLHWLPAALAILMIAGESTTTMSGENTSRWLLPVWTRLFGPISATHWREVHLTIRKVGHFIAYGLVSVTFFHGWSYSLRQMNTGHWTIWRRAAMLAVFCTLVVASSDEIHQSFLPKRTSSPVDVCIDVAGAIAAQLLLLTALHFSARRSASMQAA